MNGCNLPLSRLSTQPNDPVNNAPCHQPLVESASGTVRVVPCSESVVSSANVNGSGLRHRSERIVTTRKCVVVDQLDSMLIKTSQQFWGDFIPIADEIIRRQDGSFRMNALRLEVGGTLKRFKSPGAHLVKNVAYHLERLVYADAAMEHSRVDFFSLLLKQTHQKKTMLNNRCSRLAELVAEFFENAIRYETLIAHFKQKGIVANTQIDALWTLFIDNHAHRYGRFGFENEPGYLNNALCSFFYLFNCLRTGERLQLENIIKANRIAGGTEFGEASVLRHFIKKGQGESGDGL